MQSIEFHVAYGKRMFAERAGIDAFTCSRVAPDMNDPFFDRIQREWAERFGPYPTPDDTR